MEMSPLPLPDHLTSVIQAVLRELAIGESRGSGFDLSRGRLGSFLPQAVRRLSDNYLRRADGRQIWEDRELAGAYLVYFFPLNYLRARAVIEEAVARNFFAGFELVHDWGSGPGTMSFALMDAGIALPVVTHDASAAACDLHARLLKHWPEHGPARRRPTPRPMQGRALATFSYSLNEAPELTHQALESAGFLAIEPATRQDGRRLMELRRAALERGYHAWAPCVHQQGCPLLEKSERDWCHQRIFVEMPEWFRALEAGLPMKNWSVTYSYLLMRAESPDVARPSPAQEWVRVIGDTLVERGKIRQAICRGPEREFFSWLTKNGEPRPFPRGTLVGLPDTAQIRGSEIRLR